MKIKTALDLLTALRARARVDFRKKNGNDVCVQVASFLHTLYFPWNS